MGLEPIMPADKLGLSVEAGHDFCLDYCCEGGLMIKGTKLLSPLRTWDGVGVRWVVRTSTLIPQAPNWRLLIPRGVATQVESEASTRVGPEVVTLTFDFFDDVAF